MGRRGQVTVTEAGPEGHTTYLVHFTPTRADWPDSMTPDEDTALEAHFSQLQRLTAVGTCVVAGPTLDAQLGVCLLDGVDVGAAQELVAADAMVVAGFFDAELRAMRLSLERRAGGSSPPSPGS